MSNKIAVIEKAMGAQITQFESMLPVHIPPKKFLRTAMSALQSNPYIVDKCDQQSILESCKKAAQDGLLLDGREAALTPFKGKAQYMPMVAGILKKLRNSGQLSTIVAVTVHENDAFKYNPAMDDVPNHSPDWFGNRGKMIGVYAVAKMTDGGTVVEIMSMDQINKVRASSKTGDTGPWKDWFEEMAKKSVIRRIAKMLPSSSDVDNTFENDNENYSHTESVTDVPVTPVDAVNNEINNIIDSESVTVNQETGEILDNDPI